MRIAIATDAWYPQPNGVVRVVGTVVDRLKNLGHEILVISPDNFRTVPCPTYSELPLSLWPRKTTARLIDDLPTKRQPFSKRRDNNRQPKSA